MSFTQARRAQSSGAIFFTIEFSAQGGPQNFFMSNFRFQKSQPRIKYEGQNTSRKPSMAGSRRIFSANYNTKSKKEASQQQRQKKCTSTETKAKTQVKSSREEKIPERHQAYSISNSLDLKSIEEKRKMFRSLNLEQEGGKNEPEAGRSKNHYNCMTISPWLKQKDHPILKREKNLFEYYMNEIKRKREQRTMSKKIKRQEDSSPFIIKSVEDKYQELSSYDLSKMQEVYRNWKNSSRMLISGKAISMQKFKNAQASGKMDTCNPTKRQNGGNSSDKQHKEEGEIKAWENDVKFQKDQSPQF